MLFKKMGRHKEKNCFRFSHHHCLSRMAFKRSDVWHLFKHTIAQLHKYFLCWKIFVF